MISQSSQDSISQKLNLRGETADRLDKFYKKTKKEINHVQTAHQQTCSTYLRKLSLPGLDTENLNLETALFKILSQGDLDPLLASIVLHSAKIHFDLFHTQNQKSALYPLWFHLCSHDKGLRASTPEYNFDIDRLFKALGLPTTSQLAKSTVTDPSTAFRMGQFELSDKLNPHIGLELKTKIAIARGIDDSEAIRLIRPFLDSPNQLATLSAAQLAANLRNNKSTDESLIKTVESWCIAVEHRRTVLSQAELTRVIHAFNALNLLEMKKSNFEGVVENIIFLEKGVFPNILDAETRNHVVGNCFLHRAMIARHKPDLDSEIDYLLLAAERDYYFTTIYYRLAQILHDHKDKRASTFYHMALATSPLDYATANDFGCYLAESDQALLLSNWTTICGAIFTDVLDD